MIAELNPYTAGYDAFKRPIRPSALVRSRPSSTFPTAAPRFWVAVDLLEVGYMPSRGSRLVEAMKKRGLQKQHALAHSLGVNESTITRWKNDGPMSLVSAVELCRILDISMDWFILGTGSMEQHKSPGNTLSEEDQFLLSILSSACGKLNSLSKTLLTSFINSILS